MRLTLQVSKKEKKYTKGFYDMEMIMEHLHSQESKERRAEWLRLHANPSKDGKKPSEDVLPN